MRPDTEASALAIVAHPSARLAVQSWRGLSTCLYDIQSRHRAGLTKDERDQINQAAIELEHMARAIERSGLLHTEGAADAGT